MTDPLLSPLRRPWREHPRTALMREVGPPEVVRVTTALSVPHAAEGEVTALLASALDWFALWTGDRTVRLTAVHAAPAADVHGLTVVVTDGAWRAAGVIELTVGVFRRQWTEVVGHDNSVVCDDWLDPPAAGEARFWRHGPPTDPLNGKHAVPAWSPPADGPTVDPTALPWWSALEGVLQGDG